MRLSHGWEQEAPAPTWKTEMNAGNVEHLVSTLKRLRLWPVDNGSSWLC